jgi:hypothetical protein
MKRSLEDRLLAKIDKTTNPGHWIWLGTMDPPTAKRERKAFIRNTGQPRYHSIRQPRPVIVVEGKVQSVARLVWLTFRNPDLPEGVYVKKLKHFCVERRCVNPDCHNTPPRRLANRPQMAVVPPSQQNNRGVGVSEDIAELAEEISGRYGQRVREIPIDEISAAFPGFQEWEILAAVRKALN